MPAPSWWRNTPDRDPAELDQIAELAGIGAVKYADLSTSRMKDYAFDVDRMVSFTGNTGVYLQYAHTRIRSILRKACDPVVTINPSVPLEPAERALALKLDANPPPSPKSATSSNPIASAATSTTSPATSPPSTRPAT